MPVSERVRCQCQVRRDCKCDRTGSRWHSLFEAILITTNALPRAVTDVLKKDSAVNTSTTRRSARAIRRSKAMSARQLNRLAKAKGIDPFLGGGLNAESDEESEGADDSLEEEQEHPYRAGVVSASVSLALLMYAIC